MDIMSVREIRSWSCTMQLPGRPFGAKGVLDIRSNVVEVFDLCAILGGSETDPLPGHVVMVVSMDATNIGILVDSVSDIIFAEPENFRDAPGAGIDEQGAKTSGLVQQDERLIAVLNLNALFTGRLVRKALAGLIRSSPAECQNDFTAALYVIR